MTTRAMSWLLGATLLGAIIHAAYLGASILCLPGLALRGAGLILVPFLALLGRGGAAGVARRAFAGSAVVISLSAIFSPAEAASHASLWLALLLANLLVAVGLHVLLVLGALLVRSDRVCTGSHSQVGTSGRLSIVHAGGAFGVIDGESGSGCVPISRAGAEGCALFGGWVELGRIVGVPRFPAC